jgi:hypothetical protein
MANYVLASNVQRAARAGPYLVTLPVSMIIFALYSQLMPVGLLGSAALAVAGLLWAWFVGLLAKRAARQDRWRVRLANASVFLAILVTGLLVGGGLMYIPMMVGALDEPTTTYAVLSALMQPSVPYYITLNTVMELLLVSCLVLWNWETPPKRRRLILIAVMLYLVMRVWTYLVYADMRLDITQHTLSAADVQWFKQTLAADYRIVLNVLAHVCFILAAFVPVSDPAMAERG